MTRRRRFIRLALYNMEEAVMTAFKALRVAGVAACVAMGLLLLMAGGASASGINLCLPAKEGKGVVTPVKGICPKHYTLTELGAQGPTGPTGAQGVTGATGATGSQGAKGEAGATGSQGVTGEAGAKGESGGKGESGATGTPGATGPTGAQGEPGAAGPAGATGTAGMTGATGVAGAGFSSVQRYEGPFELTGEGAAVGTTETSSAGCPVKTTLVGGGAEVSSTGEEKGALVRSKPSNAGSQLEGTWTATAIVTKSGTGRVIIQAWVLCAS